MEKDRRRNASSITITIVKLTQHLDRIYQLVLDRADPAKVREHVEFIRDQVEAAAKIETKLRKQIARDKKSHAKEITAIQKDNQRIVAEHRELEAAHRKELAELKAHHHELEAHLKHLHDEPRKPSRREQLERAGL